MKTSLLFIAFLPAKNPKASAYSGMSYKGILLIKIGADEIGVNKGAFRLRSDEPLPHSIQG